MTNLGTKIKGRKEAAEVGMVKVIEKDLLKLKEKLLQA